MHYSKRPGPDICRYPIVFSNRIERSRFAEDGCYEADRSLMFDVVCFMNKKNSFKNSF